MPQDQTLHLLMAALPDTCRDWRDNLPGNLAQRVSLIDCDAVVAMGDSPASALRRRTSTTLGQALQLLVEGRADACVSAGNTGALMALSRYLLGMLPGIDRPAICSALPAINGTTHLLDLGANVSVTAEVLTQFAVMGAAVCRVTRDIERPRVGLLNIGTESVKGHDTVRQADQMLRGGRLNYAGFVEGRY